MDISETQRLMLRRKYARTYVLQMVTEIQREYEFGGLPKEFFKEFTLLALWQQMCCVTEEGILDWMRKWDDLLESYKMHKSLLAFVSRVDARFFEDVLEQEQQEKQEE